MSSRAASFDGKGTFGASARREWRPTGARQAWRAAMNKLLFGVADFLSRPPGFYFLLVAMVVSTALLPFGLTDFVTYVLSVAAIIITGVVLIQGYRDTAAIHAKLDEIVVALKETRDDVVGLEHADPDEIKAKIESIEQRAHQALETAETAETATKQLE
jgi:low affinity Fe/Cu permease